MKNISLVIFLSVATWVLLCCELSFGSSGSSSGSSGGGNSGSSSGSSGSGHSGSSSGSSGSGHSGSSSGSSGSGKSGSSSGSAGGDNSGSSLSNLTGSGTITAYTPGSDYIMFRREASTTPVKYYYTKSTVLVDPEGHTVEWTALRPGMPVTYTYVKEADRMVVTKVTLAARLPVEKKETETTTTKP